jgi:PIN domain nuclease of toxin-antitoxin system
MIILDSSVVVAVIRDEPRGERAAQLLETQACAMSVVNSSEVAARLTADGIDVRTTRTILDGLGIAELPFTRAEAELAAALRPVSRHLGLSLGDRACIATSMLLDATAFTADQAWAKLDLPDADIQLVR